MPLPIIEPSERHLERIIKIKVKAVKGVKACRWVKVDRTGKWPFVMVNAWLDPAADYAETHRVTALIETKVKEVLPDSKVYIRTEPFGDDRDALWELVKKTAESVPGSRGAHNIHVRKLKSGVGIDFHLEFSGDLTVKEVNEIAKQIEEKLRRANPAIKEVFIHEESVSDQLQSEVSGSGTEAKWYLEHAAKRYPEIREISVISIRRSGDKLFVSLKCGFDPATTLQRTDDVIAQYKADIQRDLPDLARLEVHLEPA